MKWISSAAVVLLGLLVLFGTAAADTPQTVLKVTTLADTNTNCQPTNCSLRAAITAANARSGADTIVFNVSGTILLGSPLPAITDDLTIDGSRQNVALNGAGKYRLLSINRSTTVTLNNLILISGKAAADCRVNKICGGAIKNRGTLTVNGCNLSNNTSDGYGGAIDNTVGTLTVTNSKFDNNTASEQGGAIFNANLGLSVSNTTFTDNRAYLGASISNSTGSVTIQSSTFDGGRASYGGGIYSLGGTLTIAGSTFSNNRVAGLAGDTGNNGGALTNFSSVATITGSKFLNNQTDALGNGGAIYNTTADLGSLQVSNSQFENNGSEFGGAIYNDTGSILGLTDTLLDANTATLHGGGLYNDSATVTIRRSTFSDNTSGTGGGGLYSDTGTVKITNSTFAENSTTTGNAGGLYNLDGAMEITNSTIAGNSASNTIWDAGGIYNDGTEVKLHNTIVANNSPYDCDDYAASLSANSYNLDSDGSCGSATQKTVGEIDLRPLKDYGGPTWTMKPGPTSAALDAADNGFCPATDQRGVTRPQGAVCDVGSVEVRVK